MSKKINFEQTHNLYSVEEGENNGSIRIDGKHNAECLNKMLESVDKALETLNHENP